MEPTQAVEVQGDSVLVCLRALEAAIPETSTLMGLPAIRADGFLLSSTSLCIQTHRTATTHIKTSDAANSNVPPHSKRDTPHIQDLSLGFYSDSQIHGDKAEVVKNTLGCFSKMQGPRKKGICILSKQGGINWDISPTGRFDSYAIIYYREGKNQATQSSGCMIDNLSMSSP